jgi:xanthine dehydrogenase small subunit
VQQALVDCHGSQCGFCTPGFAMSMFALYEKHGHATTGCAGTCEKTTPSRQEISDALTGNLCRCTGYRPIIDAAERMFDRAPLAPLNVPALARSLDSIKRDGTFHYEHAGRAFDAPRTTEALASLKAANPNVRILAGSTDVGLWVTKQLRDLGDIVYVGQIESLKRVETTEDWIEIGAGVSVDRAYDEIVKIYPELQETRLRFASLPIRNAGTLGGNVANGSPIGDSMPGLIALDARVVLQSVDGLREMALEDLYIAYQKKDMAENEFVAAIRVPTRNGRRAKFQFRAYKLSKRFDSDISAVYAAFSFIADGDSIREPRLAFGGMAATPKRASHAEAVLADAQWHEATAQAAMIALGKDYAPLTDMRASSDYRLDTAKSLLYRFWLETRPHNPLAKSKLDVRAIELVEVK